MGRVKQISQIVAFLGVLIAGAQQRVENADFEDLLQHLLTHQVPEINVDQAQASVHAVFLDAREWEEYNVSHIPASVWVGYEDFNLKRLGKIAKDQPIVVYCSVGYRSERIAQKLLDQGFLKVYNLYGGIFEWANQGFELANKSGPVKAVHTFNEEWSKWVKTPEKVF